MVVMEDVTEEERSAELYVSVHGGHKHKPFATVCKFVCFEILSRFGRIFALITLVRLAATVR